MMKITAKPAATRSIMVPTPCITCLYGGAWISILHPPGTPVQNAEKSAADAISVTIPIEKQMPRSTKNKWRGRKQEQKDI